MGLYELNKKLTISRGNGYIFNQINNFKKIFSNLSNINTCYCLKHRIPMCHWLFFRKLAQNPENIQTFCNDRRIFFLSHVANGIHILIHNIVIV